jgi:hypothetical protein
MLCHHSRSDSSRHAVHTLLLCYAFGNGPVLTVQLLYSMQQQLRKASARHSAVQPGNPAAVFINPVSMHGYQATFCRLIMNWQLQPNRSLLVSLSCLSSHADLAAA